MNSQQSKQLREFAEHDLKCAYRNSKHIVLHTKKGHVTIIYQDGTFSLNIFNFTKMSKETLFTGRREEAVEILISLYDV